MQRLYAVDRSDPVPADEYAGLMSPPASGCPKGPCLWPSCWCGRIDPPKVTDDTVHAALCVEEGCARCSS